MILTVHDELLFEVPKAQRRGIRRARARARCSRRRALNVPLTVDVGIGENWKDAKS